MRETRLRGAEALDCILNVVTADLGSDLPWPQLFLEVWRFRRALASDEVGDFRECETELLSAQNDFDAHAFGWAIEASVPYPARSNKSSILIEP